MVASAKKTGGDDLAEILQRGLSKAFEQGGASARSGLDSMGTAVKTLSDALSARETRIAELEQTSKQYLATIETLTGANTALATLASNEKIAKAQIASEKSVQMEALSYIGPAGKLLLNLIQKKLAPGLLSGGASSGGATDEQRAALKRVIMRIATNEDLGRRIVAAVGEDDWVLAITFLQNLENSVPAEEKTNGASN